LDLHDFAFQGGAIMRFRFLLLLLLLTAFAVPALFADSRVPFHISFELFVETEYNRALSVLFYGGMQSAVSLYDSINLKGGISTGYEAETTAVSYFAGAELHAKPAFNLPFDIFLSFDYLANRYPSYKIDYLSYLPALGFSYKKTGLLAGYAFRDTFSGGSRSGREQFIFAIVRCRLIETSRYALEISLTNKEAFLAGNIASYHLSFLNVFAVNNNWSLTGLLKIYQTGSSALTANFYGAALGFGGRFTL
jgi:hypothetical protein